ncbi:MAG: dinuclear metal center YbgI/SA1388 family protein [Pseudohongiellaceae bacterium]|jgi:dinuclear metal center YbgI/SA1388 family protein
MPVSLIELNSKLSTLLQPEQFKDYCPNGLQIQGSEQVAKLVSGVTASQALVDAAVAANADAILVHHGYFWQGEDQRIKGAKRKRIKTLLEHDISLFAYHLPLDVHREYGNNTQLANLLGLEIEGDLHRQNNHPLVLVGRLLEPLDHGEFVELLQSKLGRHPQSVEGSSDKISTIAWCTGAAQNYIDLAIDAGVDAYLTGEISEQTFHAAKESGIHFFSAGHHATERYGVQAVGRYLAATFTIEHEFIDIDNPV